MAPDIMRRESVAPRSMGSFHFVPHQERKCPIGVWRKEHEDLFPYCYQRRVRLTTERNATACYGVKARH